MKITELCIRRPVLACVLSLVLIVIGLVSIKQLELRYFPQIDQRIVSVSTSYSGASPELVESAVTDHIEGTLNGLEGLQSISSTSSTGRSSIKLVFDQDSNFEDAVNQVRDKVSGVRDELPPYPDVSASTVTVGTVERATLNLSFIDPNRTSEQIRDYVDKNIKQILRDVPGVGATSIFGGSDYALRIWLDAEKMAALGVTVPDVIAVLDTNNIDFPGGTIRGPHRNFSIISDTRLVDPKEFANLIIRDDDNKTVRMKDIADVEIGSKSLEESPMLINDKPGIDIEVRARSDANPITVSAGTREAIKKIKTILPKGMTVGVTYDQSIFLQSAINETIKALAEAVALVTIVVILFLGSLRAATIPIITIPVCVIASFGIMSTLGYTINTMTLLALVLAIGLVVDDAIVMLENIHRYIEKGMEPIKASIVGSSEITIPIIAMTITLAAVYAPIGFSQGLSAVIFKEFALTLSGAVIISGFVALTLSPMMCSKILKTEEPETKLQIYVGRLFEKFSNNYQGFLRVTLNKRYLVNIVFISLFALGFVFYNMLPQEFIPQEDIGYFNGNVTPPPSSSISYVDNQMKQVDKIYAKNKNIATYATFVLAGGPTSFVTLIPWDKRKETLQEVITNLNKEASQLPGIELNFSIPDPVNITSDDDGNDYTLQLTTSGTYESLQQTTDKVLAKLEKYPGLTHVRTNLKFNSLRYKIKVDRDQAASMKINPQDIATTMKTMLGGSRNTELQLGGEAYHVIVQMQKKDLENFSGLQKLYVRNADGDNIPLATLVKLTPSIGQSSLTHFDHRRSAYIVGQITEGYSIGQAIDYTNKIVPPLLRTTEYSAFSGKAEDFLTASSDMSSMFILAIVFIYLILAAQFESFIDPLIILLTVPLPIVGAIIALKLCGGTMNTYTEIGLITLIGLVSKHGILITQFANNLREDGVEFVEAIIQASTTRLRPIIMTTLAMVLGSLPLALASGPGSVGHSQIGIIIVAGLTIGTFFSLVVVPVAYFYLGKYKKIKIKTQ